MIETLVLPRDCGFFEAIQPLSSNLRRSLGKQGLEFVLFNRLFRACRDLGFQSHFQVKFQTPVTLLRPITVRGRRVFAWILVGFKIWRLGFIPFKK